MHFNLSESGKNFNAIESCISHVVGSRKLLLRLYRNNDERTFCKFFENIFRDLRFIQFRLHLYGHGNELVHSILGFVAIVSS